MVGPSNGSSHSTVIFLHVPKTGGRTLERMLITRLFEDEEIGRIDITRFSQEVTGLLARPEQEKRALRILMGHFGFGIHRLVAQRCTYFTLLRHPIDRVVSLYYHVKRDPNHPVFEAVQDMSLAEFTESGILQAETENCQTRLLSGDLYGVDSALRPRHLASCGPDALDRACANLERHFSLAGVMERFDETLLLLGETLKWPVRLYVPRNVGRNRPSTEALNEADLGVIERHNKLDLELYRLVGERLSQKLEAAGPAFQKRLRRFQRWRRLYGWFYPVARPLLRPLLKHIS